LARCVLTSCAQRGSLDQASPANRRSFTGSGEAATPGMSCAQGAVICCSVSICHLVNSITACVHGAAAAVIALDVSATGPGGQSAACSAVIRSLSHLAGSGG